MFARLGFRGEESGKPAIDSESWMDYSIRMHLRDTITNNNPNNNEDDMERRGYEDDGSASAYEAIEVPHSVTAHNADLIYHEKTVVPVAPMADSEDLEEDAHNPVNSSEYGYDSPNYYSSPEKFDVTNLRTSESNTTEDTNITSTSSHSGSSNTGHGKQRNSGPLHKYFGLRRNNCRSSSVSRFIVPRTSLPYTIEQNPITNEWMAIINTDQDRVVGGSSGDSEKNDDADKIVTLKFETLHEAREACHSYAPPRMHSFEDNENCHICKKTFHKVLRRPSHCRNCGICVCFSCSTIWPASMVPVTYLKRARKMMVKVCVACDWLSEAFRSSLIDGDTDKAVTLFHTGNVNLRCPFTKGKNES